MVVPALLAAVLNLIVMLLALDTFQAAVFGIAILGEVPDAPLIEAPFHFLVNNAAETATMAIAALASLATASLLLFAYSRMLTAKKASLKDGFLFALSRLGAALGLSVFALVTLFLYGVAAFLLLMASVSFELTGLVAFLALLAWLAFGAYVYTKLVFTPLFISIEGLNVKKALAESWKWSSGRFIPLVIFLFLLWAATGIIVGFGDIVGAAVGTALGGAVDPDLVAFIAFLLGFLAASAYFNIVFTKFFVETRQ